MYNQHTRGIETTRHGSLVERGGRKALLETLHTHKKNVKKNPIFTKTIFEHIELPAKLLDYFLRSNKRNINQSTSSSTQYDCNLVTTFTHKLAARSANSDMILLPRISLSYLQSYLSLARFILNSYVSCGRWVTCRHLCISISSGMKRTSGVSVSSGVELAHSGMIGMRSVLQLHTLQPKRVRTHLSIHGTAYPMSATSVRPRSMDEYLISSTVDISHLRQQGNPRAGTSAASGLVCSDIMNGFGANDAGGGDNPSLSHRMATGAFN